MALTNKLKSSQKPVKDKTREGSIGNPDWATKSLLKPGATIRIGTLFSGIGAAEHAIGRLGLRPKIVFAGDIDKYVKASYFANYHITENEWHDDE